MLARVLATALCLSVCLSVCLSQVGVLSKRLNVSSWFLAWELPSTCPTVYCKKIRPPSKITARISLWNFIPNSGLRKFRHGISIVEACYRLSSRKVDCSERDKLDCRRTTKLTIPPSSDARPLVYHSDRQAPATALFRRAGPLATADTRCCRPWPVH